MRTSSPPPPRSNIDTPGKDDSRHCLHDLRGPLSVIRGHVRLLSRATGGELSEEQRHSIATIDRQVLRIERLLGAYESQELPDAPIGSTLFSGALSPEALSPPRILVADDDPDLVGLLVELLSSRYELVFAADGREALTVLGSQPLQLAIIDLHLPMLNGLEIAEALRAAELPRAPALMFLSAESDPQTKVRALALGAADYVTKPFDPEELAARVARIIAIVGREASLRADAMTDPLTGLANYRSLAEGMKREIERSRRYGQPLSLITLDLDHLKTINDAQGHDAGDEAIRQVARVLKGAVRSFEVVARQGGDEFAVLLPNTGPSEAELLAERLRAEVAAQSVRGFALSASIGVASRDSGRDLGAKDLLKASDEALYRAKYAGRNRIERG